MSKATTKEKDRGRARPPSLRRKPEEIEGSREARRTAAVVLEVLAGERKPAEASKALGISANHYYSVETRGLQGMVSALEPVKRGKRVDPETRIAALEKRNKRLEAELARTRTLLRMAQRAVGIPLAEKAKARSGKKGGKKKAEGGKARRKVRPLVRARRAIAAFRKDPGPEALPGKEETCTPGVPKE